MKASHIPTMNPKAEDFDAIWTDSFARIILPGIPTPQARPRFSRRGKFVATYDSQKDIKHAKQRQLLSQIFGKDEFIDPTSSPISLRLSFLMPIPNSDSQPQKNAKLWHSAHHIKPDLDNLVKFTLDLCNTILWLDDSQISHLSASKKYSLSPCTIIEFKAINKSMNNIPLAAKIFNPEELHDLYCDLMHLANKIAAMHAASDDEKEHFLFDISSELTLFSTTYLHKLKKLAKQ